MFNTCNSDSDDEQAILWPQNFLGPKFTNFTGKSVKYMSLDTRLFIAGELNIIRSNQIDPNDQRHRFDHLCDTLFNIGHYEWPAILKLHAAILTEINNGSAKWGDDFSRMEQQMLMPFTLNKQDKRSNPIMVI